MAEARKESVAASEAELVAWFERTGYVRRCDPQRRLREGETYKKGHEVRFILDSHNEVRLLRRLVRAVGLRPGRAFGKHSRIVLPVYGVVAVRWFLARLPSGRERATMGFSPNGQRIARRPTDRFRDVT